MCVQSQKRHVIGAGTGGTSHLFSHVLDNMGVKDEMFAL